MTYRLLHLIFTALLLLAPSVPTLAQEVLLSCDPSSKWGYVTESSLLAPSPSVVLEAPGRILQQINTVELTQSSAPDSRGDSRRTGTAKVVRFCGPFTFVFSSGWHNANPMGEMGADEFSVFEVQLAGKLALGPLALGTCDTGGRSWGTCPSDWVTSLTFQWDEPFRQPVFYLRHTFEEQRGAP